MPDYKKLFEKLCVDAGLSEHMGDVQRAVRDGLINAGHDMAGFVNEYDELQYQWFVDHGLTKE